MAIQRRLKHAPELIATTNAMLNRLNSATVVETGKDTILPSVPVWGRKAHVWDVKCHACIGQEGDRCDDLVHIAMRAPWKIRRRLRTYVRAR